MYIFLTGFMASGKTKNGRIMAEGLGYEFYDLDHIIEHEGQKSINAIYADLGEEAFRRLELDTLIKYTQREGENIIFSLGGGSYCNPTARHWLRKIGKTIFLDVPVGILFQGLIVKKETRPLLRHLSDKELLDTITTLHKKRYSDYMEADVIMPNFQGSESDRILLKAAIIKASQ